MNEPEFLATLANRIDAVEARVAAACRRANRPRDAVAVVAVTKALTIAGTRLVRECGLDRLGENRPQQLWKKAADIPGVDWHFIGHLQRNKIDKTLPAASLIHAVDSVRLLQAIDAEAAKQQRVAKVLLEINVSGESTKQGFQPDEALGLVDAIAPLNAVRVDGLMTMAAPLPNPEECRPTFAALRTLRDRLRERLAPKHPCGELSMGMTNDFEIAIEEGATLVRLGSVYFAGIEM